jgi:hypothetical protein
MTAAALSAELARPRARRRHVDDTDALSRIAAHEEVCEIRQGEILRRLGRLETIVITAAGTLIAGMGALIVTLVMQGHH